MCPRLVYGQSLETFGALSSIPIARSRFKRLYTAASFSKFSVFSKTSILLPNFEENPALT
jgi:hypothetical protein